MNTFQRIVLALIPLATSVALAAAEEPPAAPKRAKVEYYWTESKPVPDVTVKEGLVWNERGGLLYRHQQPILTNDDVASVRITKTVFGLSNPVEHFTAQFELTKQGRKKLADSCDASGEGLLVVLIDGRHFGTPFYLKSRDEANFAPFAGMFPSQELADKITATFAPPAAK